MISTRGKYALRVMIDLAEHSGGAFTPLKEIAQRQEIPAKYTEKIMTSLTRHGLIEGIHGRGGGYRLCRTPQEYRVGEILRASEGDLAPVSCLEHSAEPCVRAGSCRTRSMWENYYKMTNDYFDAIPLTDLVHHRTQWGDML